MVYQSANSAEGRGKIFHHEGRDLDNIRGVENVSSNDRQERKQKAVQLP